MSMATSTPCSFNITESTLSSSTSSSRHLYFGSCTSQLTGRDRRPQLPQWQITRVKIYRNKCSPNILKLRTQRVDRERTKTIRASSGSLWQLQNRKILTCRVIAILYCYRSQLQELERRSLSSSKVLPKSKASNLTKGTVTPRLLVLLMVTLES